MPFLYENPEGWMAKAPHLSPLFQPQAVPDDAVGYFKLCLAAHHATVSSFVPTDVDNQIRHRLWQGLSGPTGADAVITMAQFVLESREWDYRPLSPRWVQSPVSGRRLAGHDGEWLSTAIAAYGALRKRTPELALAVRDEIAKDLENEATVFDELVKSRDGLGALRACTLVAHNLGDLNRVIEMWALENDPHVDFGVASDRRFAMACDLNRVKMAAENHRHLALRKPRSLRKSIDFFLPLSPFLDDWGMRLARHPLLSPEELAEIVEALIEGLERTPGSIGYTRAIAGIESVFRGGPQALQNYLPAREARRLKAGSLRAMISQRREHFESQWASFALQFCKNYY